MNTGKFKVLFLSERAGFAGGIERFIFHTANLLRDAGVEMLGQFERPDRDAERFLGAFDRLCPPGEEAQADLAVIHRITDPRRLEQLLTTCGDRLALYVHDHDCYCPRTYKYTPLRNNCDRAYSMFRCGLCAMMTSPRRWRDGFWKELRSRTTLCRERLDLLRRIPRVAVLSRFMRDNLIANGFAPDRVTVIPPPVALPETVPPRPDNAPPRLLFTGQLIRGKGVDFLLRALPLVRNPFRLVIAGDGNHRPELECLAAKLGVTDKVDFAGWVSEPESLYSSCDIAVLPFFWQEPFGLVGPEASARELPIAAFRIGGVDEWLRDGENGIAVPPRDVGKFAAAIDRLLEDRELRLRLGRRGREIVRENFSEAGFVKHFLIWSGKDRS